jgi:xanthine dehydrogenase iron-sulfur cluster and FAD-binding subunit A
MAASLGFVAGDRPDDDDHGRLAGREVVADLGHELLVIGRRGAHGTVTAVPGRTSRTPTSGASAVALVSGDPKAQYLAGGTTQVDLMLKDGVLGPERLVDITRLPLRGITRDGDVLRVGALATMEELAADVTVAERLPFVREALLASASTQLRSRRVMVR